jgi:hypothetical protein
MGINSAPLDTIVFVAPLTLKLAQPDDVSVDCAQSFARQSKQRYG